MIVKYKVNLRTDKPNKEGLCPVSISIRANHKQIYYNPGINVHADYFENGLILKGASNYDIYNAKLAGMIADAERELLHMEGRGEHVTLEIAKQLLNPGKNFTKDISLFDFAGQFISLQDYEQSTKDAVNAVINKLRKYLPGLTLTMVTPTFLATYRKYLKEKLNNEDNTVWTNLKFINTIILAAHKKGLIRTNPFDEFDRGVFTQGIPDYLEWEEIQKVHNAVKNEPLLDDVQLVGWYFLLSCYSGLRFGDCVSFRYNERVKEDGTGRRLILKAEKNGQIVSIKFNKYISEVVDAIRYRPIEISNSDFNMHLRTVAAVSKVKLDISSHVGRHSFGMRCAELNISIERTQKLMGHRSMSSTQVYYRIKNKSLDDDMASWEV